jgi:hypothetical protein
VDDFKAEGRRTEHSVIVVVQAAWRKSRRASDVRGIDAAHTVIPSVNVGHRVGEYSAETQGADQGWPDNHDSRNHISNQQAAPRLRKIQEETPPPF